MDKIALAECVGSVSIGGKVDITAAWRNAAFASAAFKSQYAVGACLLLQLMHQIAARKFSEELMIKQYLVASSDEGLKTWPPFIVEADRSDQAIDKFLRQVYSKDPEFRDFVLDMSINCSFIERFFIATGAEKTQFDETGRVDYDLKVIAKRVRKFFTKRPDLGEKFLSYMDTRNESELDDDVFEFISAADPSGILAFDIEAIPRLR